MTDVIMYGIKNCDTIKKAKKWLEQNEIEFQFHDYRVDGIDETWLKNAVAKLGWENVVNKRGTTYRQLSDEVKANLDETSAIEEMLKAPAMIKRPILQFDENLKLGFKDTDYSKLFGL